MSVLHSTLTGADLHEPKPHAASHDAGGADEISTLGDVVVQSLQVQDSNALILGTGGDATILYDGTDIIIDPQAVGSGAVEVQSIFRIVGPDNNAVMELVTNDETQRWRFQARQTDGAFFIREQTAGTLPFLIEADAPTDTVHLDSGGDVTLGGDLTVTGSVTAASAAVSGSITGGDLTVTGSITAAGIADGTNGRVPAGAMALWGTNTPPTGWLICDGAAISRTTFASLFAVIGTIYGAGDGSTTFNIPDLRQRFPLGKAAAGTGSTLAGTGGSIDHTHTDGSLAVASHAHAAGSYAAAAHAHAAGSLAAASHAHAAGSLAAASHTHGAGSLAAAPHTHGIDSNSDSRFDGSDESFSYVDDVDSSTGSAAPAVTGSTAASAPGVTGATAAAAPNVTGSTGAASPGVTGSTGSAAPAVSGTSGAASPGVTGATGSNNPPYLVLNFIIKFN